MISLWKGRRRIIFGALVASALGQAIAAAAAAWCVQHLFDVLTGGSGAAGYDLHFLGGAFAGAALLGFLLELLQRRLGEGLSLDYAADVRLRLFDHHLKAPAGQLAGSSHGAVLLPFVGDLAAIKQWVSSGLARMAAALVTTIALLLILAGRNLVVAGSIAAALLVGAAVLLALGSPLQSAVHEVRRRRGALAGFVSSRLAGVTAIQSMGRSESERKKVVARTEALNQAGRRRAWITGGMRGIAQLTGSLLVLATLLAGKHEIAAGRLSPAEVVGALSLVALLAAGMHDVARGLEMWYPARISRQRIAAALRQPLRRRFSSTGAELSPSPDLILQAVAIDPGLSGISACARPGEVVLVEGETGAGKSSLLGCIAQVMELKAGAVLHRGKDLRSLSPRSLNRIIGFASPALPLLRGSIGMNLRYRRPAASVEETAELVANCGLERLLSRLPKGLETRLDDGGTNLSLGERQALLLARALLGEPPILLIDSIDSHLDAAVVQWLAGRLRTYRGIVLMTAVRPELADCATRAWRIEGGTLTERPAINVPLPSSRNKIFRGEKSERSSACQQ